MTRRRRREGRRRRDGRRRRRELGVASVGGVGGEFLEHGRELARISRWKARSAEEAGSETGSEACAAGDGDWDCDAVDGCEVAAKWARRTRGICPRARAPRRRRRRARRRIDAPGGGDARTADAERAARRGGAGSVGEVDTRSRARGRSGARGRRLEGVGVAGSGSPPDASVSARDSRQRPPPRRPRPTAPRGWRSRRSSSPEFAMATVDLRAIPDDDPRGGEWHEATRGARRRTLNSKRARASASSRRNQGSRARRTAQGPHTCRRDPRAMSSARRLTRALSRPFLSPVSPRGVSGDAARSVAAGRSTAVIALGSNQGDRVEIFREALRRLAAAGLMVTRHSSLYETAPAYVTDQPAFLNAAAVVRAEDPALASDPRAPRRAQDDRARPRPRRGRSSLRPASHRPRRHLPRARRATPANASRYPTPDSPSAASVLAPLADLPHRRRRPAIDHPNVAAGLRRFALSL